MIAGVNGRLVYLRFGADAAYRRSAEHDMSGIRSFTKRRRSVVARALLVLAVIAALGAIIGTYSATRLVVRRLLALERRLDHTAAQEYTQRVDDMVSEIKEVFLRVYHPDFFGYSLSTLLNRNLHTELSPHIRVGHMLDQVEAIARTYTFVSDVVLVDYQSNNLHFYSRLPGRAVNTSFSSASSALLDDLHRSENPVSIFATRYPEYLASHGSIDPVFSVGLTIFDAQRVPLRDPLGAMIINVGTAELADMAKAVDPTGDIRFVVVEERRMRVLFDSTARPDDLALVSFDAGNYDDDRFIVSEFPVGSGYLRVFSLVDRASLLQVYRRSRRVMVGVLLATIVALAAATAGMSHRIELRFVPIRKHMEFVRHGDLTHRIPIVQRDEIGTIEEAFNEMCRRLDDHIQEVYAARLKYRTAQLRMLQQQMNPHFMYNTLQSIQMSALDHKDTDTAEMLLALGEIFRWALDSVTEVSLGEELLYLQTYVSLQAIRFERAIALAIEVSGDLKKCTLPKLTLQPLVENSIQHGFSETGGGIVTVYAAQRDDYVDIEVHDNGIGIDPDDAQRIIASLRHGPDTEYESVDGRPNRHVGLRNVHSRLRMYYEPDRTVGVTELHPEPAGGTRVRITIPAKIGRAES